MTQTTANDHTHFAPKPAEGVNSPNQAPGERIEQYAADVGNAIKEHPIAAVAVAAGLAFVVGALWKLQASRRTSPLENLLARLPDLPSPERLARRWR